MSDQPENSPEKTPIYDRQAQSVADYFIKSLENGTSRFVQPWKPGQSGAQGIEMPYNPTTGKGYRGGNMLALLFAQQELMAQGKVEDPDDHRWLTYKQAQAVGASVRKGEKATMCVAWKEWTPRDQDGKTAEKDDDDSQGKRLFAYPFYVFHASQIEGLPPRPVREVQEMAPNEQIERVKAMVAEQGVKLTEAGGEAYYMPMRDHIFMPPRDTFMSDGAFAAVLLHELGHATGHESRLNRTFSFDRRNPEYAREELRAEMFSYAASQRLGVEYDPGQHAAYVGSWIKMLKEDPREILRAASDVERICDYVKLPQPTYEVLPQVKPTLEQERSAVPGLSQVAESAASRPARTASKGRGR